MGCVSSKSNEHCRPNVFHVWNVDDMGNRVNPGEIIITETDLILYQRAKQPVRSVPYSYCSGSNFFFIIIFLPTTDRAWFFFFLLPLLTDGRWKACGVTGSIQSCFLSKVADDVQPVQACMLSDAGVPRRCSPYCKSIFRVSEMLPLRQTRSLLWL